ncbi:VWA domain-containing protein [Beggiatoa alba]|nr:VWA domain-containing protein [Beggiatoa alba]
MLETLTLLNFSHPIFLLAILLPPVILFCSYLLNLLSSSRYCDKELLSWVTLDPRETLLEKFKQGKVIVLICWLLVCVAIAGPRVIIDKRSTISTEEYTNATVFVLDLSKSMLAEDLYPNRISKAKLIIDTMIANSDKRLFSLVVFAKNAHTVIPLTYDGSVIRRVLASIQPNMLPVEGSDFTAGLNTAIVQLNQFDATNKSIVLLSDGDFYNKKINPDRDTSETIPVNVFGIGTEEGQAIPLKKGGWLSFENSPVITRINEVNLKNIAKRYNGRYHRIKNDINNETIISTMVSAQNLSTKETSNTLTIWKSIHGWFLIPALMLYIFSTIAINKKTDGS